MIDLSPLAGSRFAVLGLARSGMATARALAKARIDFVAWDDDAARRAAAIAEGFPVADLANLDWARHDGLAMSPGIPHTLPAPHPVAAAARAAGRPPIGDIELLARVAAPARIVGITGTNGKSTTTALIGHVLGAAGIDHEVGGNLGPPVLDFRRLDADGVYVLELSSFQLELVPSLRCSVSVWLNVTPDHLDRHGDLAGYVAAKRHVFDNQTPRDTAVVCVDDAESAREALRLGAMGREVVTVGVRDREGATIAVDDGVLLDRRDGARVDLKSIGTLPGAHNWQNAAAAYATCRALGLPRARIAAGLATYPGLAHRQERVAIVDGVLYVNDSKATNADAAEKALAAYEPIYWIVGGTPKADGIEPLTPLFGRVAHAFLVGTSSDAFASTLDGRVFFTRCRDLATAVDKARAMASAERRPGAVVLLSPACASYDQWRSFEHRGDAFRAMVHALPGAIAESGGAP